MMSVLAALFLAASIAVFQVGSSGPGGAAARAQIHVGQLIIRHQRVAQQGVNPQAEEFFQFREGGPLVADGDLVARQLVQVLPMGGPCHRNQLRELRQPCRG